MALQGTVLIKCNAFVFKQVIIKPQERLSEVYVPSVLLLPQLVGFMLPSKACVSA